jgi:hypothetical protein
MNLEDQIVSLELAKKLKELGVKQETVFIWYPHDEQLKTRNRYFLQSTNDSNYDTDLWPLDHAFAAFAPATTEK